MVGLCRSVCTPKVPCRKFNGPVLAMDTLVIGRVMLKGRCQAASRTSWLWGNTVSFLDAKGSHSPLPLLSSDRLETEAWGSKLVDDLDRDAFSVGMAP